MRSSWRWPAAPTMAELATGVGGVVGRMEDPTKASAGWSTVGHWCCGEALGGAMIGFGKGAAGESPVDG